MIQLISRATSFKERIALISDGRSLSYSELLKASATVASNLLNNQKDLNESRIAFLVPPSFEYTAVQWGIWRAGGIAVPLCVLHPLPSIEYVLENTGANTVIAHADFKEFLEPLQEKLEVSVVSLDKFLETSTITLPDIAMHRRAMILYTSGTTSKPKGVVSTHANIEAQITTLVNAWAWEKDDAILNVLPLHHVHGIINVMSCALWVGASCEFHSKFEAEKVWEVIASGRLSLFMAVPTIYYKLITYWEGCEEEQRLSLSEAASKLRLMVSGSAALPVPVLEKWRKITGQTLLERYGMTEIGMGLSNAYDGERRPGHVGLPLPGVELRLVGQDNKEVLPGEEGEIQVKGPSVFKEYWQNKEATKNAFTEDGWFITGDIAKLHNGLYKILGRDSVDIIKSGGYKISALEIEDVLRNFDVVDDCAVVGVPNEEYGEVVAACLISKQSNVDFDAISQRLKEVLPAYKVPRIFIQRNALPRNVLGKVTKNELIPFFNTNVSPDKA
ncbi:MAG: acyl-CoA synthetase [Flavobacteriaceae bacterium]